MIIEKITLTNFRQFLGKNELIVENAALPGRNVSLIVGANGAGKTTLLSALHFAFHGENLDSLDKPNRFCHEDVFLALQDGEDTEVQVEVEFSRDASRFALQRTLKIRRFGVEELRLQEDVMLLNMSDGRLITPPGRWINSWFPPNLAKFFFFPGEHLEDFFNQDKFSKFLEDIKSLAGLDKVESILESGKSVIQKLQKRISGIPGDNQATLLVDAISHLTNKKEALAAEIVDHSATLTSLRTEFVQVEKYLAAKEKEIGLVAELSELRHRVSALKIEGNSIEIEISAFLKSKGWVALSQPAQARAKVRLKKMDEAGLLERNLSKALIADLLVGVRCVCGTSIEEGSSSRAALEALLGAYGSIGAPHRYAALNRSLETGLLNLSELSNSWRELQDRIRGVHQELETLQLKEKALTGSIAVETKDTYLESQLIRRDEIASLSEKLGFELEELEALQGDLDGKLAGKKADLAEAEASKGRHGILIRQMQALERVLESIASDAAGIKQTLRAEMEEELNLQVRPIYMNEPVTLTVGPNYEVAVSKNGVSFGESKGQKVVRALALVLVLHRISTRLAIDRDSHDDQKASQNFPLVIDAGFGVLDKSFIKIATDWLSQLDAQVVLILLGNTAEAVIDRLGEEGELTVLELRQKSHGQDEVRQLGESQLTLIRYNQPQKSTAIVRISR